MTTRQGTQYKPIETPGEMASEEVRVGGPASEETSDNTITQLMEMLIQERADRQKEKAQRKERTAKREEDMQRQIQLLTQLVNKKDRDPLTIDHRDQVKLTKLGDGDDIESYITTFERMMVAYEVPKERWVYKLAPNLTGRAQQAYTGLTIEEAGNYETVKRAILERYDVNPETYRRRLRNLSKEPSETYREMAVRGMDLFKKWTRQCKTLEEVSEVVVTEQVLTSMPEDIQIWVRENKPATAAEAGRLAGDYMQARAPVSHSRVADIAERPTNLQAALGNQTTSYQPSHQGLSPNTRPWSQAVSREKVTCFASGNQGHMRRPCPVKVEPNNVQFSGLALMEGEPQTGSVLRKLGHIGEKQSNDILLDMGSTQTLIRKDMLPVDAVIKGEH